MLMWLIIYSVHCQRFYVGTNATLIAIQQQFWIPTAMQCIKSLVCHCTTCCRHGGKHCATPDPPPLPEIWICDSIPFTITGIDLTGALYVVRKAHKTKFIYACLLVPQLVQFILKLWLTYVIAQTFLWAFRRFISWRSVPKILVSDNASTYLAAADKLQWLLWSDLLTEVLGRWNVLWHFIPKCVHLGMASGGSVSSVN